MPLQWRVNILELLKSRGYSTYRLRKDKLLSESTIQHLREAKPLSWYDLETVCRLTGKQPGKLIEFAPEKKGDK